MTDLPIALLARVDQAALRGTGPALRRRDRATVVAGAVAAHTAGVNGVTGPVLVARVLLGVHYPSDVVSRAAIEATVAAVVRGALPSPGRA